MPLWMESSPSVAVNVFGGNNLQRRAQRILQDVRQPESFLIREMAGDLAVASLNRL